MILYQSFFIFKWDCYTERFSLFSFSPPPPGFFRSSIEFIILKKNPQCIANTYCNYSTLTLKLPHIWPVGVLQIGLCPKLITRILCVFWHNMFQNYPVLPHPRSGTNQKRASEWLNTNLLTLILNPSGCGGVWGVGWGPSWLVCKWRHASHCLRLYTQTQEWQKTPRKTHISKQ